jgi:hypothetical protein
MLPDQAAGLRRRAGGTLHALHGFSSVPAMGERLVAALQRHGWRVLRIETGERPSRQTPARSLFDGPQQLARRQLNVLALEHGDVWLAPGLRADAAGLAAVAARYDAVLLHADFTCEAWTPMPGAENHVIVDVPMETQALQHAFRLLKTLSRCRSGSTVSLIGDALACARLQDASRRFLDTVFVRTLSCFSEEVEPISALAARMAGEEKGRSARC